MVLLIWRLNAQPQVCDFLFHGFMISTLDRFHPLDKLINTSTPIAILYDRLCLSTQKIGNGQGGSIIDISKNRQLIDPPLTFLCLQ